jgi:hypothetical protein
LWRSEIIHRINHQSRIDRFRAGHDLNRPAVTIDAMECRPHCAACCIAPSISSPIPGMTPVNGVCKPAGVRCVQLDDDDRCRLFGHPSRPAVCCSLRPSLEMCGDSREQALRWLGHLERQTAPATEPA